MARLFTREFIEEGIAQCNADPQLLQLAALLSGRVVLRALDTPDSTDVQVAYVFERGRCESFQFNEAPAPSSLRQSPFAPLVDGLMRITATYQDWVAVDRGDIEPEDALQAKSYRVEAKLIMLLPLMQAINAWTGKVRSLPKQY